MDEDFHASVVIANRVMFRAKTVEDLSEDLLKEAEYWSSVFPDGIRNPLSETVLRPNYSRLLEVMRRHSFEDGPLSLKDRPDVAVFPASNTVEGRALTHYAQTGLAFAIVQFLWAEAGCLLENGENVPEDEVAGTIGEMLITSVRLGSSF